MRVEQPQAVPRRVVPHQVRADDRRVRVDQYVAARPARSSASSGSSLVTSQPARDAGRRPARSPAAPPVASSGRPQHGLPGAAVQRDDLHLTRPVQRVVVDARRQPQHRRPVGVRGIQVGDRRHRGDRGDPAPGAVPPGRVGVPQQTARHPGQRIGDDQPRRRARTPPGCAAPSAPGPGRGPSPRPDRRQRPASAARSAPIEQVRSCTPTPASRRARCAATGAGRGLLQRLVGEQPRARPRAQLAHRPAAQPDRLGDRAVPGRPAAVRSRVRSRSRVLSVSGSAAGGQPAPRHPRELTRKRTSSRVNG